MIGKRWRTDRRFTPSGRSQETSAVTTAAAVGSAISTIGLTKDYGDGRGVFDVSLNVQVGEIMGFLGPNGSGKSTTMRLLLGLASPTGGLVRLLGLDPVDDGQALRRRVGYLPGDLALYPGLTGATVLNYFARLRGGVLRSSIIGLAERFDAQLNRPIRELSTGNRQKLGLIQAFMHEPELLILDEPIAGLDPLVQSHFHELLSTIRAEGRTVLLSSHTLSEIGLVADRVAILRAGRLVALDTLDHLRKVAVRRWDIEFALPPDPESFARLPGMREVTVDGARLGLAFDGATDDVLKTAAQFQVIDLHTREGDLEDIFLRYYRVDLTETT